MAENQEEIEVTALQAAGELVYFMYSGLRDAFTSPEPQPAPTPYRHFTPNFPEGQLNPQYRQADHQGTAARYPPWLQQEPVDQGPPVPVERPPSPNDRMPGTWDAFDYSNPVVSVESTDPQEEVNIQPDPGLVEETGDHPQNQVENDADSGGADSGGVDSGDVDKNNQSPAVSNGGTAPQDCNEAVVPAGPSTSGISPVVNHVKWAIGPPSSRSSSPRPSTVEEASHSADGGGEPSTSRSQPAESTQAALLHPPVVNGDNRSQDRLSVSSYGGDGTSSGQESSGKKGFRKKVRGFFADWKSPSKKQGPKGKGKGPELLTNPLDAAQEPSPRSDPPTRLTGLAKLDVDDLGWLHRACPKTWGELLTELAPLGPFAHIIGCLQTIFDAVDAIKANKVHWRGLGSHCVSMSRLLAFQYQNYGRDEERRKPVDTACEMVYETLRDIESSARKWSDKGPIVAFAQFEMMATDIEMHIERLNASRGILNTALGMATEALTTEIAANQKAELEETRKLYKIISEQTDALKQLKQQVELSDRQRNEFEKDVKSRLQQYMSTLNGPQGDDTDIEKIIDFIDSLTGVQLPAEHFLKKICTNVSGEPISRAPTGTVYKAKLAGGQLVAKKVLEIGKYSEGDVRTYALKMRRDTNEWRKFNSQYTLPCLGIGMEKYIVPCRRNGVDYSDEVFKMYMVSPFFENMDAMTYLKPLREFANGQATLRIDKRSILRIAEGAALGLVEVHRHNSVHSNMRGENILVGSDGMGILGGFGLTKSLQNHKTGRLPSIEQTQAPPYRWMAPECANPKGNPDVTQANDVWGWAMTTLQIVTGVKPIRNVQNDFFLFSDDARSHFTIKRKEYPEFEGFAHQPDALWALLTQCWNRNPNKRPSMEKVASQLARIISQS